VAVCLCSSFSPAAKRQEARLANEHIRADFRQANGAWRLAALSRADGSDAIDLASDEFEILLFDDRSFTAKDYRGAGGKRLVGPDGSQSLVARYQRRPGSAGKAPRGVTVTYTLGTGPVLHKTVTLEMDRRGRVDRLAVLRFSTSRKASRGGRGEPVFLGNWFLGADYPCFYSRHSDSFAEPDYFYRWDYHIDLAGRDKEFAPRKGLVTVFHFPGNARRQADGSWGIVSKRAVMGLGRRPGDSAELALLDYIAETRKCPRSHLHYNNWYSPEGKDLSLGHFLPTVYRPIHGKLREYGARLEAIVPDHGWENSKTFEYIFQPRVDERHPPLPALARALKEPDGTGLGIWIALDGTNQSTARGRKVGYRLAYGPGFARERKWMAGKQYFSLLDPKYQRDLKKALRFLIVDAGVEYIKHDFNHNFTSGHLSQRHAREACLDVTLDLLRYERSLRPGIYQNYTNGTWFSPWWLQHADALWMMSGDSGNSREWPLLSQRDRATSYRDKYFFESFNNPQRCARPVIPIANFMTHGIISAGKKPFTDGRDLPEDWANHVVMYFARGTMVKELYLTPSLLSEGQWEVLGRACDWAVRNQQRLVNTVMVGGNPARGQAYGFVSWVAGRAILAVRNPNRDTQVLTVPFDETVYYRGGKGKAYRARAIYPFVEPMPWSLTSGRPFTVTVGGDRVVVFEIDPGPPRAQGRLVGEPLPPARARVEAGAIRLTLRVPDERMKRHELIVQPWGMVDVDLTVNGKAVAARQGAKDARWSIHAFDLTAYRGQTIQLAGRLTWDPAGRRKTARAVATEAWVLADRPVAAGPAPVGQHLPVAISQGFRRVSQRVLTRQSVPVGVKQQPPGPGVGGPRGTSGRCPTCTCPHRGSSTTSWRTN